MRLADVLYFAPGVRFVDVDLRGAALPAQYRQRMLGFYVEPAEQCAARGQAFAAGCKLLGTRYQLSLYQRAFIRSR